MKQFQDKQFNIDNYQGGSVQNPVDDRDYKFGELMAIGAVTGVSDKEWDDGYDSEEYVGVKLTHENQDGSLSCVAQTVQKVGEGLNFIETGELLDFSAKRIYEEIALPGGGAYTAVGAKFACDNGFMAEKDSPSYENGQPPSEAYMTKKLAYSKEKLNNEKKFKSNRYYYAYTIDEMATAIKNQKFIIMSANGENSGWQNGDLKPPQSIAWGHAFMGKSFKRRLNPNNGIIQKAIKIHNSWGNLWGYGGDGWIYEDYFKAGHVHSGIALVDQANLKTMGINIKLVKTANAPTVYLIGLGDGLYHPVFNAKIALDLFGKTWAEMNIEAIDKIPADKIGYLFGGIIS